MSRIILKKTTNYENSITFILEMLRRYSVLEMIPLPKDQKEVFLL